MTQSLSLVAYRKLVFSLTYSQLKIGGDTYNKPQKKLEANIALHANILEYKQNQSLYSDFLQINKGN